MAVLFGSRSIYRVTLSSWFMYSRRFIMTQMVKARPFCQNSTQVSIYLVMGWLIVIAFKPLLRVLPMSGFYCLLTGGLFYSVGVVFYALDTKQPPALAGGCLVDRKQTINRETSRIP